MKKKNAPLASTAFIQFLDLLGEGELEGFPSARAFTRDTTAYNTALLKDVYFDKTPVLRSSANALSPSDDDFNFKNVTLTARYGTANQSYIPTFTRVENETSVGVEVEADSPVTRTITDTDVDRVAVIHNFPVLQKITEEGKIKGSSINYQIQVAYAGGAFTTVVDSVVTGRAREPYQRTDTIALTGAFPVDIKVIRVTEDSTNAKVQNAFSWLGYTEITDAKLSYKHSALVGLELSARDFGQIPVRSYRVRGLRIQLPTNATVDYENGRVTYSGVWNGTFGAAEWCSDPAWCLWDLLTNSRYGFNLATQDLDKFSFYQASVYCNELVDDGLGGQEPRFSCNISIQNQTEAYKLINDMCSVFRAMPYWSAGSIMIAQDRPSDPIYLFNQTNVTEEGFQYTGSSLKTRHTVAVVGYLDIENQELAYESVEDLEGIARYGVITTEITAFACTSRSQAYRLGEWLLYTEQYENETVTFKASMDAGINVRPGMIIAISDPVRSGVRRGGRIAAASSTYIIVDEVAATNLPLGGSPTILVALTDGTVASKTVTSVSGDKITISGAFDVPPLAGGVFIYNDNSMSSTTWRVLGVQEQNGTDYSISAVSYNVSKYDYIERGRSLVRKTYLPPATSVPVAPINASATVASYVENGQLQNTLVVDWQGSPGAVEYEVSYRLVDE
jgi:predicted phage tail protein